MTAKEWLRDLIRRGDDPTKPAWFTYEQACKDALAEIERLEKLTETETAAHAATLRINASLRQQLDAYTDRMIAAGLLS